MNVYFILVNTKPLEEQHAYMTISKMGEVSEIHPLFGEYDFLVKVETLNNEDAKKIIDKIRMVKGILATKTLTGIK